MAKYTHIETRPIVTLDYGQGPSSYYAAAGERTLSSDGSLFFKHMALTPLSRATVQEHPVPTEAPAPESGLTNEQETALHNVLQTAKIIERGKFNAARAIERAVAEAEATRKADEHQFNLAVLTAMHEGITQEDVELHLMGAGFSQLEEKVDSIHMLDTVMLYETEA